MKYGRQAKRSCCQLAAMGRVADMVRHVNHFNNLQTNFIIKKEKKMNFFGVSKESIIQKNLRSSKLSLQHIELHMAEFAMIEQTAADYLGKSGVRYRDLPQEDAWLILVGALVAMEYAERCQEIPDDRVADCVPLTFQGLLMMGLPERMFFKLYGQISKQENSETNENLRSLLISKGGYSKYEATIKSLATTVNVCLETRRHYGESNVNWGVTTENAIYSFYLNAKYDYFCGVPDKASQRPNEGPSA